MVTPKSPVPMGREVSGGRLVSWVSEDVGWAVGVLWAFRGRGGGSSIGTMSQRVRRSVSSSSSSFSAPEAQRETVFVCASCNQTLSK